MKANPFTEIADFVVSNLPDSVRERKRILSALIEVLPKGHAKRPQSSLLLAYLISHEQQQLEFPISGDGANPPVVKSGT